SNAFSSTSTSGADMTELNLSSVAGLQNLAAGNVVTFRIVPYGATSSAGTWYVYNHTGNDLVVSGSIAASGGSAPPPLPPARLAQPPALPSSSPSGAGTSPNVPPVSASPSGATGNSTRVSSPTSSPRSASIVDLGFDPFADLF